MDFYSICKLLEVIGLNVNFLLGNSRDDAVRPKQKVYYASMLVLHLPVSTCALILAGIELIFLLVAGIVLCFRYSMRIMLITH